ncbi:poly(A) polymerase [Tolumonas auensis DSM 9187]|uniref:Poly(A) polymerase I n=1 Tax=Tolumonas auensis (strain DSM 9187 / NBRC 110442 / TA 4) TaxID=595494 RepID=C4L927_TOLAT|nr:poly(A) polymerase [Tolumonas auensis DSM 9187]
MRYHTARSFFVSEIPRCTIFSHIANLYRKVLGKEETPATPKTTPTEPAAPKRQRAVSEKKTAVSSGSPRRILTRDQHSISRSMISENALKVLYRLHKAGYQGYLVGGGVRDLLLGKIPKDFDVVTDAHPEQIRKLFNNCRLIGRRFRLAHIVFGRDIIEVATFRGHHHQVNTSKNIAEQSEEGMLLRDNVYGTIEEDAERRDFTVNALYYNIKDFSLHDFHGGLNDLAAGKLELIGDPETRYREDPVRMLRAVRFAAKLGLTISDRSAEPISRLAPLLQDIPSARLFEETIKLFLAGHALSTYQLLRKFGLFQQLFPQAAKLLTPDNNSAYERFLEKALANSDKRVATEQPVTPTFFYATLLWGVVAMRQREISNESNLPYLDSMQMAMNEAIEQQIHRVAIPRRFTSDVREIWLLQERLPRYSGKRAEKLFAQPKFRAAFDFLELRAHVEPRLRDIVAWWQDYQQTHDFIRPEHTHARPARTATATTAAVEQPQSEEHAPRKRPHRRRRYPQQSGQRRHD